MKVIGYWMRILVSSCSADVGKITAQDKHTWSATTRKTASRRKGVNGRGLTFVSSVDLRFADECGTVASVAPQEDVSWVGVATTHIALHIDVATSIVALVLAFIAATKPVPLKKSNLWLTRSLQNPKSYHF